MNSETLNNQCCIMETVFLRNIIMTTVQLLKNTKRSLVLSSKSGSSCHKAAAGCVRLKVHLGQFLQSVFSFVFSGYISRCSALTHMFPQACNMLHRATSSSSLPALTHFTGWMTKSSLTGRGFSCSSVSVC